MIASITGLHLPLGEVDRAQHDLFGQLLGLRLDHQHRIGGAGDEPCRELSLGKLLDGVGFSMYSPVDIADPGAEDGTEEGNSGDGQRRRGPDQRRNVGVVLQVVAQHRADDLGLVAVAAREERPDRPVDQPRGQAFPFPTGGLRA